jgi:lipid-binding SYLF domain-containing protein
MSRLLLIALILTAAGPSVAAGPPTPAETLRDATDVLDDLRALPLKGIPPALLADAKAVAVFPSVVKAGFVVGGRYGRGVVLCRADDGRWGDPVFVRLTGAGVGAQAGIESTDLVLVFKSRAGLDRVLAGKGKLALGGEASIAAGPVGREAAAATDARLRAEIYSYSRTRGLFAGLTLGGAVIASDLDANRAFGRDAGPDVSRAAEDLKTRLAEMSDANRKPRR